MHILIINAGSSSIKFQLILMPSEKVICSGMVERIGSNNSVLTYKSDKTNIKETKSILTHKNGLQNIVDILLDKTVGAIKNTNQIAAVGHRVVHGGKYFVGTTLITNEVKEKINELAPLAPLHNPHNLEGILIAEELFSEAKQIAIFDTAFHRTIPEIASKYAIPSTFYDKHGLQLYGFHGTSHKYVSEKAISYLNKDDSKIISIHLGNGCSATAIVEGKSIDHSLGFAPANGLIMGSRSGDIDHSIIFYLVNKLGYNLDDVNKLLTKESGMLGLTGYNDLRDIQLEAEKGNIECILALEMNAYRIKKYIGAYTAAMNGLDAIIFTAGIGENSQVLRKLVCSDMDYLDIRLDDKKNKIISNSLREINVNDSKIKILVIPTNEELEIAIQVFEKLS
ncbi:acetate kinase [Aurantibacter sp.]|uniref:acetate/propionate family kinase n=1 Tax=Aurantibacter sp. TaxID=2807103 RepID=UPI003267DDFC